MAGEIDIVTAPALAAFLARCLGDTAEAADAGDAGDLVLDLSGVSIMDGRGLTACRMPITWPAIWASGCG